MHDGDTVLEFGPATGYMTKALNTLKGCKMYLVEIDEETGKVAGQFAEDVVIGDVEQYDWAVRYEGMKFDRILFADILEHLRQPDKLLQRCKDFLKPGGSMVLSVPNVAHNAIVIDLLKDNFEYHELGLLDKTHIHLFTKTTLERMLESVGLYPVYADATYAPVRDIEFTSDIHDIPQIGPEFWNERPYGSIYQYIYEVSPERPEACDVRINPVPRIEILEDVAQPQQQPAPTGLLARIRRRIRR